MCITYINQSSSDPEEISIHDDAPFWAIISAVCGREGTTEI